MGILYGLLQPSFTSPHPSSVILCSVKPLNKTYSHGKSYNQQGQNNTNGQTYVIPYRILSGFVTKGCIFDSDFIQLAKICEIAAIMPL